MQKACVNAIVFSPESSELLIIKRRDVPIWVLPGGAIDPGESPEHAVLREVYEETGCRVKIVRKSAVYYPVNRLAENTHVFVCEVVQGTPVTGAETQEAAYFPLSALPQDFFHIHQDFLEDAFKHPEKMLEKKLTQVTYLELFKYFLKHPVKVVRFALSKWGFPINAKR